MLKQSGFQIETRIMWIDAIFQLEILKYGKVSYETKVLRHYYLKRLLDLQLKEFDRGE